MKKTITSLLIATALSTSAMANESMSNVIVSLSDESQASLTAVLSDYQLLAKYEYSTVFTGFAASVPTAMISLLQQDPRVASISADTPVSTTYNSNLGCGLLFNCDTQGQVVPWGVSRIGANFEQNTGAGVHVYVIDTGIDSDHPDLARWLMEEGIDSVSLNPDTVLETWLYLAEKHGK